MMKKSLSKIGVYALSMLLVALVTFGATYAYLSYSVVATGTITLSNNLSIDYTNLNGSAGNYTLILSSSTGILPGSVVTITNPTIKKSSNSPEMFIRIRIAYQIDSASKQYLTTTTAINNFKSSYEIEDLLSIDGSGWVQDSTNKSLWYLGAQKASLSPTNSSHKLSSTAKSLFSSGNKISFKTSATSFGYSTLKIYVEFEARQASSDALADW